MVAIKSQEESHYLRFEPGDVIIQKGDVTKDVYRLVTGFVDVYKNDGVVAEIAPGEYFGTLSAFTGAKRNATVIARSKSVVRRIEQRDFLEMLRRDPSIGRMFR